MLRKKTEQVHMEIPVADCAELEAKTAVFRAQLKKKGMATLGALLLLVSVAVIGTVAWFTRVSSVTGMTMDVAKYDFNANYTEETFIINVSDFLTLKEGKAAPGTTGIIPIRIGTEDSETAVTYSLALDFSEMADEFRDRIHFYYYTKSGATYTIHSIDPASSTDISNQISGTVDPEGTKYEYIYWEWVYELNSDWFADSGKWYHKAADATETYAYGTATNWTGKQIFDSIYPKIVSASSTNVSLASATDSFDDFDTAIGMGKMNSTIECHFDGQANTVSADPDANGKVGKLYAYQKAMKMKLHVTGAQAEPVPGEAPVASGTDGTAVYKN